MGYICESCGELSNSEIVSTCGQCGHVGVRPGNNSYVCPECGEVENENLVQACRKCGGTVEEI